MGLFSRLTSPARTTAAGDSSSLPWMIVGLGNPGPQYEGTRHNVGFMTVDELCRRAGASWSRNRSARADVAETRISAAGLGVPGLGSTRIVLVKPLTFMNESGQAVRRLGSFYKTAVERVVVIHDELDLDLDQIRLKQGGGDNGHNGLKSIRAHLGSGEFFRVRLGIGRPPGRQSGADYVLAKFAKAEQDGLASAIDRAADAVETLVTTDLATAQNRFNS